MLYISSNHRSVQFLHLVASLKILPTIFTVTQGTQATPGSSAQKITSPGWRPSWVWYLAEAPALSAVARNAVPALTSLSGSLLVTSEGSCFIGRTFSCLQCLSETFLVVSELSAPFLGLFLAFSTRMANSVMVQLLTGFPVVKTGINS